MKKFFPACIFILTIFFFFSCSNDTVTPNAPDGSYSWNIHVNGLFGGTLENIRIGDNNTIFATDNSSCYKITNGIVENINFADSAFWVDAVDAYSGSYFAAAGNIATGSYPLILKIYNGGVLTTVTLGDSVFSDAKGVLILSEGKIAVHTSTAIYLYDNGSIRYFPSPDTYSTNFNNMVVSGSTIYISGSNRKIYKLENNALSTVDAGTGTGEYYRMSIPGTIIKTIRTETPATNLYYWNGSVWNLLATDNSAKIYFAAAGESLSSMYFIASDSTTYAKGMILKQGVITADVNFPPDNSPSGNLTTAFSNMKNNTIYISKYTGTFRNNIYKGVKN